MLWQRIIQNSVYAPRCSLCGESLKGEAEAGLNLCGACQKALPLIRHRCLHCGLPLAQDAEHCGDCQGSHFHFESILSLFRYAHPLSWLVQDFKFSGRLHQGRVLAELIRRHGRLFLDDPPDYLLPVPLHPRRFWDRGFNQAAQLFEPLARQHGLRMRHDLCQRSLRTPAQTGLDLVQRKRNLRDAFEIIGDCRGDDIVLLDDVVTSAATVNELAGLLRRHGAGRVRVWSLARTPVSF